LHFNRKYWFWVMDMDVRKKETDALIYLTKGLTNNVCMFKNHNKKILKHLIVFKRCFWSHELHFLYLYYTGHVGCWWYWDRKIIEFLAKARVGCNTCRALAPSEVRDSRWHLIWVIKYTVLTLTSTLICPRFVQISSRIHCYNWGQF
jgi:hypothetical protein